MSPSLINDETKRDAEVGRKQDCRITLERISKGDLLLRLASKSHYSEPGGFVGRFLGYGVWCGSEYIGVIVAGSATMHLVGRNDYFGVTPADLNRIINNTLFHVERPWGVPPFRYGVTGFGISIEERRRPYPVRNITNLVLSEWRTRAARDWEETYQDSVIGFETLVQVPRTGEVYRRDGWSLVGETKGFTCRRTGGISQSEKFDGRRIWTFDPTKRKLVFCRWANS
ncbi:MAG TPA: hypothetical protein VG796_08040 [Verrucomicrobiales bacterium]|nr:hypothetical protein [Verrucomicrobiales bacterium]